MAILLRTLVIGLMIFVASCSSEKSAPSLEIVCEDVSSDFETDIKPIITDSCAICHYTGASNVPWTYDSDIVLQEESQKDRFLKAINHTGPIPMPYGMDQLSASSIAKIECWINAGSPIE